MWHFSFIYEIWLRQKTQNDMITALSHIWPHLYWSHRDKHSWFKFSPVLWEYHLTWKNLPEDAWGLWSQSARDEWHWAEKTENKHRDNVPGSAMFTHCSLTYSVPNLNFAQVFSPPPFFCQLRKSRSANQKSTTDNHILATVPCYPHVCLHHEDFKYCISSITQFCCNIP